MPQQQNSGLSRLSRFAPLVERAEGAGEMAAGGSQWYNEVQPHLLTLSGPGDSGAVRVLSLPRYAVFSCEHTCT